MVDLGFLLITFFVFTASLSQPTVTRLIMPKEGDSTAVAQRNALTFLLDKGKVYAYEGIWEEALLKNSVAETGYDMQKGMGTIIRQKQKSLAAKDDLMVLLKPLRSSSYENVMAALDEMQINVVKKYALVDATEAEASFVQKQ